MQVTLYSFENKRKSIQLIAIWDCVGHITIRAFLFLNYSISRYNNNNNNNNNIWVNSQVANNTNSTAQHTTHTHTNNKGYKQNTHETRQAMHVKINTEVRSCNPCSSGKAISITYSECVFIALVIRQPTCMRHVVICGLSGSTNIRPHYLINGTFFVKKKKASEHKMCFDFL